MTQVRLYKFLIFYVLYYDNWALIERDIHRPFQTPSRTFERRFIFIWKKSADEFFSNLAVNKQCTEVQPYQ